ncbi:malate dehydrogenase, cytoplasmic-like isoform X2 [Syzygium oleosum]|uniref:malate dehydrogenase, cytoplasmic-like isoform X2 n=1 Tax=Syzygium oleosum TaxID=219896 RepID=UPI0011D207C8|nr:malate dehydrogenase, cytoplasmic-like isoform X2 [Syzygium oleosum]
MARQEAVRVLVTDAGGPIAQDLVCLIARGVMLGYDQPVILHLFHSATNVKALEDLERALMDSVLPLLEGVVVTTNVEQACKGIGFAILIGEFLGKTKTFRLEAMANSFGIYKRQVDALEKHAAANCKVLVIANPADRLALVLKEFAPSIPLNNITCLTRPDHNRALSRISQRLNVPDYVVKNVIIWGNHSSTQYPDVNHAMVNTSSGEYLVRELINDDAWWNDGGFITDFQERTAEISQSPWDLRARSIAQGACDHIHDWVLGTPEGRWVSMGVYSDGSYNVPVGLIYSFPVTCRNGEWTIVQGLPLDEFSRKKMDSTVKELMEQRMLNVDSLLHCIWRRHSA